MQIARFRRRFKERTLLDVPVNKHIIFMASSAFAHFADVPLNLLGDKKAAEYIVTGFWSERAIGEAAKFCNSSHTFDGKPGNCSNIAPSS